LKNKNDLSAQVAWTLSKNVSNECVRPVYETCTM